MAQHRAAAGATAVVFPDRQPNRQRLLPTNYFPFVLTTVWTATLGCSTLSRGRVLGIGFDALHGNRRITDRSRFRHPVYGSLTRVQLVSG
jgi:hypothetical protein